MANINIPDSALFQAGAGPDLKLTHDSNNSIISNATGTLTINNIADANMILGTDDTTAVTIDNSQNVTIAGNLTSTGIDDNASQTALSITSEGRVQHTSSIANSCFDIANTHASGYGAHIQAGSGSLYSLMVKDKDNSPRFTVLGDGRCGIGETSPETAIHITSTGGGVGSAIMLEDSNASTDQKKIRFYTGSQKAYFDIPNDAFDNSTGKTITFETDDGNLHIDTNEGVSKFIFTQNAKLGIGTASPSQVLTIKHSEPSILFIHDSTELGFIGDCANFLTGSSPSSSSFGVRSDGDFRIGTGGNNLRMTIDSAGYVGIGVTSLKT